jgi:hypothetical protein
MKFKFRLNRAKELFITFIVVSLGFFFLITVLSGNFFSLNVEFIFKSLIEPFKSVPWNSKSRILTPAAIALMGTSFFIENKYIRLPLMLITVVFYFFIGIAVVVSET